MANVLEGTSTTSIRAASSCPTGDEILILFGVLPNANGLQGSCPSRTCPSRAISTGQEGQDIAYIIRAADFFKGTSTTGTSTTCTSTPSSFTACKWSAATETYCTD